MRRLRWPAAALAILAVAALGWPRAVAGVRTFNEARDVRSRIVDRIDADLRVVRAELDTASIAVPQRDALRARLAAAAGRIASLPRPDSALVTTVLPPNAAHAAVLDVHGAWLAAAGRPPLVVWKTHRYDAVPLLALPPARGVKNPRKTMRSCG